MKIIFGFIFLKNFTFRGIFKWLKKYIIFSKTLPFMMGLIFSLTFTEFGVINVLMDYLGVIWDRNMRKSAIVVNLQDGLSSIFVVLTHFLESYTGQFNLILLCTASYAMGLSLFWSSKDFGMICKAVALTAFGRASKPSDFVRFQLEENVRKSRENSRELSSDHQNKERGDNSSEHQMEDTELQNQDDKIYTKEIIINSDNGNRDEITEIGLENQNRDDSRESRCTNYEHQNKEDYKDGRGISSEHENSEQNKEAKRVNFNTSLWIGIASICGIILSSCFPTKSETQWKKSFKVATVFLGAAYLLFYSGCFSYSFEEPCGSPLGKICRVFKSALKRLNLKYPPAPKDGTIRLKPKVPKLWRWLDKAAPIKGVDVEFEEQEKQGKKNGETCSVKEVSEVKGFSSLMHMSFTFWPFTLVVASAKTFFVEQHGTLKPDMDDIYLFIISSVTSSIVNSLFNVKKLRKHKQWITIVRIGAGMLCAVFCCITAGLLEHRRLSLTRKEGIGGSRDRKLSMSSKVLIPQFILLGLMKGLAQQGLKNFYYIRVAESIKGFVEPFVEFVLGIGKLLTIPCIFLFRPWFKDSINTSHLDRYFLMLAILNIVALGWFLYYSLKYAYPNDEELGNDEQGQEDVFVE